MQDFFVENVCVMSQFIISELIPFDLRFLRILRLTRLFRIFKLNRYFNAMNLIMKVVKEKKEEILVTVFLMFFIILISSTLIFYLEIEAQLNMFPNIIASLKSGGFLLLQRLNMEIYAL